MISYLQNYKKIKQNQQIKINYNFNYLLVVTIGTIKDKAISIQSILEWTK